MKIKKVYQKRFTTVDNTVLNDTELSWKAKGLFVYLWSQADEWEFYETEVVKHSTDGIASLKAGLKELETTGYLKRKRKRNEKGHFKENEWLLSEQPMLENRMLDNLIYENRTLTNTNNNNTNINNSSSKQLDETNAFVAYQMSGATLNGKTMPMLTDYVQRLGNDLVCHAIDIMSVQAEHPNFNFLQKILDSYESSGITTVEQAIEIEKQFKAKKQQRQNNWSNSYTSKTNEAW